MGALRERNEQPSVEVESQPKPNQAARTSTWWTTNTAPLAFIRENHPVGADVGLLLRTVRPVDPADTGGSLSRERRGGFTHERHRSRHEVIVHHQLDAGLEVT